MIPTDGRREPQTEASWSRRWTGSAVRIGGPPPRPQRSEAEKPVAVSPNRMTQRRKGGWPSVIIWRKVGRARTESGESRRGGAGPRALTGVPGGTSRRRGGSGGGATNLKAGEGRRGAKKEGETVPMRRGPQYDVSRVRTSAVSVTSRPSRSILRGSSLSTES